MYPENARRPAPAIASDPPRSIGHTQPDCCVVQADWAARGLRVLPFALSSLRTRPLLRDARLARNKGRAPSRPAPLLSAGSLPYQWVLRSTRSTTQLIRAPTRLRSAPPPAIHSWQPPSAPRLCGPDWSPATTRPAQPYSLLTKDLRVALGLRSLVNQGSAHSLWTTVLG
jgi:hypothetical protein